MRMFLAFALLFVVAGCGTAPAPSTSKEQAAPKVTSGKQASGAQLEEAGH